MIKRYIQKYLPMLTEEKIKDFFQKEGISLSQEETRFLLDYTKKNWSYLFENPSKIYTDLKQMLNPTTYQQIEPILIFYQEKYKSYL